MLIFSLYKIDDTMPGNGLGRIVDILNNTMIGYVTFRHQKTGYEPVNAGPSIAGKDSQVIEPAIIIDKPNNVAENTKNKVANRGYPLRRPAFQVIITFLSRKTLEMVINVRIVAPISNTWPCYCNTSTVASLLPAPPPDQGPAAGRPRGGRAVGTGLRGARRRRRRGRPHRPARR